MARKGKKRDGTLSERQRKIIEFFYTFQQENNYPPSIREIGKAAGISSTSVVNYNLNRLEEMGFIARKKTVSRGIRLLAPALALLGEGAETLRDFVQVPLVGRIVASEPVPVPASDFDLMPDEFVPLARELVRDEKELFALEVQGDSMIDALISDGDIVIMRRQKDADNGDLVAVWLPDQEETTLKKFYREGNRVRLQPANPYMAPIYVDARDVQIQGRVMLVIRRLH